MLLTGRTKGVATSRSTWLLVLVIAVSMISVDAVLLVGLVNMFTVGQFILTALAATLLAAGLLVTVAEFGSFAKQD